MGMAEEIKVLAEDIITSHEARVRALGQLIKSTHDMCAGFKKEHEQMAADLKKDAAALKSNLAKGEKDRIKTFTELMDRINSTIKSVKDDVATLAGETQSMMGGFQKDRRQMASDLGKAAEELKSNLAKGEKDRIKTFNELMDRIDSTIKSVKDDVATLAGETRSMMGGFRKDRKQMASDLGNAAEELKSNLAKGEKDRIRNFSELMERVDSTINAVQQGVIELAGKTQSMIKGFQKGRKQMASELKKEAVELKSDLAKGEKARLENFADMMNGILSVIKSIRKDRKQMADNWKAFFGPKSRGSSRITMSGRPLVSAGYEVKTVKEAVKKPKKKAAAPKKPVKKAKKVTPPKPAPIKKVEVQKAKTLEEQILEYVASHPSRGVKVSEMEGPIGIQRLKLGKITKELLEAGKLRKEENKYFPV